jgi:intein/homing endonuclease
VLGFDKQFEDWDETCFVAGTPIKLANGQTKAIEEIQIGDSIQSFDEEKQEFVNGKVTKIFKKQALSHLQITLSNGELIEVTEEHPFYTSTGWIAAKELKPDSKIKTINGFIKISSIKRLEGEIEVYNFEVEKFHTYLVGSIGAVVHNKCSENNPYLVAWRKHKANGGSGLGFNIDGEATDQEFLDFIGSPEGQQYLNEYGEAAQGVNGSLFSWSVGRGVGSGLRWIGKQFERSNETIIRSIDNPGSLEGATIQEVERLIPKGWIKESSARGGGLRYRDPNRPGDQIRIMPGQKNDPNPVKQGSYVRISIRGVKSAPISLKGN